jgi:LPS sulfotransferase NodH
MNRSPAGVELEAGKLPSRGYLICCLERTGSTLLAKSLSKTEVAGHPIEYFNPVMQDKPRIREILGDSALVEGLDKILAAGTTPNGVFGAKVHWGHFRFLGMLLQGEWRPPELSAMYDLLRAQLPTLLSPREASELLSAHFPGLKAHEASFALVRSRIPDLRVIWLRRQNMVARAISLYRARRTGVWFRASGNPGAVPSEQPLDFDLGEIHTLYCIAAFQEERWRQFFQEQNISPLCLTYEELVADYEGAIRGALRFLELEDSGLAIPEPASQKQSDGLSEEWERRYRELVPEVSN